MEMIDGPMILKFIEDSSEFKKYAEGNFELIKRNSETQQKAAESMAMDSEESRDDGVTAVDLEGYKSELKEMMTAVAKGIGNTPVNILFEGDDSLWLKVYEFEVSRIIKEKKEEEEKKKIEEEEKKKIEEEEERKREKGNKFDSKKVEFIGVRKMKKKNSFDFLNFCGCSGKQFAGNN